MGSSNGGQKGTALKNRLFKVQISDDHLENILSNRAKVLSELPGDTVDVLATTQYVTFRIGTERYAVDVNFVEEIQPLKDLTLVPCSPNFIAGAVNIRGNIRPVIDIKKFFNMPETGFADKNKIIVIRCKDMHFGLLTDAVEEVIELTQEAIEHQTDAVPGVEERFFRGVTSDAVIILDIETFSADKRLIIHEDI